MLLSFYQTLASCIISVISNDKPKFGLKVFWDTRFLDLESKCVVSIKMNFANYIYYILVVTFNPFILSTCAV